MKRNEMPAGTTLPGGDRPKQEAVRRLFDKEHLDAWERIRGDKQLRGILGEFTIGFNKRNILTVEDVEYFLKKFPTLDSFRAPVMRRNQFLIDIRDLNGPEKEKQYVEKLAEFERIMYGKSEEQK